LAVELESPLHSAAHGHGSKSPIKSFTLTLRTLLARPDPEDDSSRARRNLLTIPEYRRSRLIIYIRNICCIFCHEESRPKMFESGTRVLVILPRDLADRARVLAGRATTSMKLPVSLQIVLRALIDEGLKRPTDSGLLANMSRQAETVRRIRQEARRRPASRAGRGPAGRPRP